MNLNNIETQYFGENAYIKELGEYEIGRFVVYSGHYDLPINEKYCKEKVFTLDKAIKLLELEGYRVASAQEIAQARIEGGSDAKICRGGMTKEALIYFPKKGLAMMTKISPLLSNIYPNFFSLFGFLAGEKKTCSDYFRL